MREALHDLCALDWSIISPAILGSLFQRIMVSNARRNLDAHYTSEENILKLIKPLFLYALGQNFKKFKAVYVSKARCTSLVPMPCRQLGLAFCYQNNAVIFR